MILIQCFLVETSNTLINTNRNRANIDTNNPIGHTLPCATKLLFCTTAVIPNMLSVVFPKKVSHNKRKNPNINNHRIKERNNTSIRFFFSSLYCIVFRKNPKTIISPRLIPMKEK